MHIKIESGSGSGALGILGTGVALMFPDQRWIGVLLVLVAIGIFLFDIRVEHGGVESGGHRLGKLFFAHEWSRRRRMIALWGMILCGVGFVGFFAVYFWPTDRSPHSVAAVALEAVPPVGTLQMGTPYLLVERNVHTDEYAAQITVEIKNASNKTIFFHAATAGRINGIWFDQNKVEFDSYIPALGSTILHSRRITELRPLQQKTISDPSFDGVYEYDISYRFAESASKDFPRRTARGLHAQYWHPIPDEKPGTVVKNPLQVSFYNEVEQ